MLLFKLQHCPPEFIVCHLRNGNDKLGCYPLRFRFDKVKKFVHSSCGTSRHRYVPAYKVPADKPLNSNPRKGMVRSGISFRFLLPILCLLAAAIRFDAFGAETLSNYVAYHSEGRSTIFTTSTGQRLRLTPYGDYIVRIQTVRQGESFFPDDRYEMVESHNWGGTLRLTEHESSFSLQTGADDGLAVDVAKAPVRLTFFQRGQSIPLLQDNDGMLWDGNAICSDFIYNSEEHFTGLGHGYFGRSDRLDLQGQMVQRNYGESHGDQAPLIVPFYLSSKGYGLFLNSTFPNAFDFGKDTLYRISIRGEGRMDYFFILGPSFTRIIDRYTQLTGRPRLPSSCNVRACAVGQGE